jgi:hypothetical protein
MAFRPGVAALIVLGAAAGAPARAAERIAVLELTGQTIGEDMRRALTDRARAAALEPARRAGFDVMTRESTALVLEQMGGQCLEGQCELELGRTIGAALIVTGEVRKLEGAYLCDLKIHDTKKGSLLAVEPYRADDPLALLDRTPAAAERLVTTGLARTVGADGSLELDVADAGARVLLDGAEVGRGPLRKALVTPVGTHRVLVDLAGYATWESAVNVQPRNVTMVSPRLVPLAGVAISPERGLDQRDTYVEATGVLIGNPSSHLIGEGPGYDLRLGQWLSPSWAGEVAFAQTVGAPRDMSASSLTGSAGAAWSPVRSRWFSVAALAGYTSTAWTFHYYSATTPDLSSSITSWSGTVELRTDLRIAGGLAFAARAGGYVRFNQYPPGGKEFLESISPTRNIATGSTTYGLDVRAGLRYAF